MNDNKVKNEKSTHYELWKDFEAIDIIKELLTHEEYIGFLKGNILKYQLRLSKKGGIETVEADKEKISDYTGELNSIL